MLQILFFRFFIFEKLLGLVVDTKQGQSQDPSVWGNGFFLFGENGCLKRGSGGRDSSCLEKIVVWREDSSGLALEKILLVWL